jgi:Leucine Rich repeat
MFVAAEGAFRLANAIKRRKIQTLDLRLNPIKTEGASVICSWARYQPVETLSMACCSIDDTIDVLLLPILRGHTTLRSFDISSNKLNDVSLAYFMNSMSLYQENPFQGEDLSMKVLNFSEWAVRS